MFTCMSGCSLGGICLISKHTSSKLEKYSKVERSFSSKSTDTYIVIHFALTYSYMYTDVCTGSLSEVAVAHIYANNIANASSVIKRPGILNMSRLLEWPRTR